MANQKRGKKQLLEKSRNSIWLSFDLGIQGDYEGLYTWLDSNDSHECVGNLAFLNYEHRGDLLTELKADLEASVNLDKRSKIYAIYLDPSTKKMKGRFLFGKRKSSPWAGYSPKEEVEEDNA
jgi:hypothetical protein